MTKYLSILSVCIAVWLLSSLVPQADGLGYYQIQALWSFMVAFVVLEIQLSRLTITLAFINQSAMIFQLFAGHYYLTDNMISDKNYTNMVSYINMSEAAALVVWVPGGLEKIKKLYNNLQLYGVMFRVNLGLVWRGISNRFPNLWGSRRNRRADSHYRL